METNQQIVNNQAVKTQPGEDVQAGIIKLWELIYNTVEEKKVLLQWKNDLEAKYSRLSKGIEEQGGITQHLRDKILELEQSNEEKNQYIEALQSENSELKDKITQLKIFETKYDELTENYENLMKEAIDLSDKTTVLGQSSEDLIQLRSKFEELSIENQELKTQIEKNNALEKDIQYVQKEIARKNIELHNRADEIFELKEQISKLESKVHELKNSKILNEQVLSENAELKNKNTELEKRISELSALQNTEITDNNLVGTDNSAEITYYKNIQEEQEKALQEYSEQILELKLKNSESQRTLNSLNTLMESQEQAIIQIKIENEELKKDSYSKDLEIENLKKNTVDTEKLIGENFKISKEKEDIENNLRKNYDKRLNELLLEINGKESLIKEKDEQVNKLESLLSIKQSQIKTLELELGDNLKKSQEFEEKKHKLAEGIENYLNKIDKALSN
jgi:chromosome segregation ATPase